MDEERGGGRTGGMTDQGDHQPVPQPAHLGQGAPRELHRPLIAGARVHRQRLSRTTGDGGTAGLDSGRDTRPAGAAEHFVERVRLHQLATGRCRVPLGTTKSSPALRVIDSRPSISTVRAARGTATRLIDDGDLPPGARLPPGHTLASALAVGRTTVVAAYHLLRSGRHGDAAGRTVTAVFGGPLTRS